jgi:hypothetical protein
VIGLIQKPPAEVLLKIIIFLFILTKFNVKAQNIKTVKISAEFEPEEVSIAISPQNPANMVAGSNLDRVYTSTDSGKTWSNRQLKSKYGVYGDPCLVAGGANRFYYFHLSNFKHGNWIDRIVCQRSDDGGKTWNKGTFTGLNGKKNQDKHWVRVIPGKQHDTLYVAWTQFDKYESRAPGDSSAIMFSASYNSGKTFSQPIIISKFKGNCLDDDNTVEGAVPAIHPDGSILVAWAGPKGLRFNRSFNRGKTFMPEEKWIAEMPGGWDIAIKGIYRANGLPVTECDRSSSRFRGRTYVCWAEDRENNGNPDIYLTFSDDKGENWTSPQKVNTEDRPAPQFMPWICVSKETGNIYCLYYSRKNHPESLQTEVFLSWSTDGGATFKEKVLSQNAFTPDSKTFFGDYLNITCEKGILRPIWMELDGSGLSIHTALLNEKDFQ